MNIVSHPRIGLALGGGGARGFAHIGILKIFHQANISVDFVAGTSAGSLIGGMYSQLLDPQKIEQRIREFLNSETYRQLGFRKSFMGNKSTDVFSHLITHLKEKIVINLAHSRRALISPDKLNTVLEELLDDGFIQDGKVPFCAVASDIITGTDVYLRTGPIRSAILASSSIPGFLPPVVRDGKFLLDGAVTQKVPIMAARLMGADVVIAVDVSQKLSGETSLNNILEIINRTTHITSEKLTENQLLDADIVIRPDVGDYPWYEFDRFEQFLKAGEEAAIGALPKIKKITTRRYFLKKRIKSILVKV